MLAVFPLGVPRPQACSMADAVPQTTVTQLLGLDKPQEIDTSDGRNGCSPEPHREDRGFGGQGVLLLRKSAGMGMREGRGGRVGCRPTGRKRAVQRASPRAPLKERVSAPP